MLYLENSMKNFTTKNIFYTIAFINGAAILIVEIAATRLLSPYFGASVFVWTSSISVILGALTVGYFLGSRAARKDNARWELTKAFVFAALTTFAAPFVVNLIGGSLPAIYAGELPTLQSFVFTLFAALVALMPAGVAFGYVSPLIIEILGRDHEHPGEISGRIFALSTAGSIVGAITTPLVFYVVFGTHMTFVVVACVVVLMAAVSATTKKGFYIVLSIILLLTGIASQPDPLAAKGAIFAQETPYQTIRIFEDHEKFRMVFNQGLGIQSTQVKHTPWTGNYWDWLTFVPFLHKKDVLDTLVIGFAGGTVPRLWRETPVKEKIDSIDAVDVDPAVFDITEEHFDSNLFDAIPIVDDGRRYLASTNKSYDLILVDAYANEVQIPFHMTTVEFFQLTKNRLDEDGLLVFNLGIGSGSRLSPPLLQATRAVFDHVYIFDTPDTFNTLIVASTSAQNVSNFPEAIAQAAMPTVPNFSLARIAHDENVIPFVDDRAPVEFLTDLTVFDVR